MTDLEIAEVLYRMCPTVKPTWDQTSATTRSVWLRMVLEAPDAMEAKAAAWLVLND